MAYDMDRVRGSIRRRAAFVMAAVFSVALVAGGSARAIIRPFVGLYGGDVRHVAFAPDGSVVLAGSLQGVFRSIDGGQTWLPSATGLERRFVQDIEFHPRDSSIVFAAAGSHLFRSDDGGLTWHSNTPLGRIGVSDVAVSASMPDRMVAATQGSMVASSDGGATWTPIFDRSDALASDTLGIGTVGVDPQDPNNVFTCASRQIDGRSYNDLYRSTNNGETWQRVTSFINCGELIWNPRHDGEVWLVDGMRPWRSTDAGQTWTRVDTIGGTTYDVAMSPAGDSAYAVGNMLGSPRLWTSRNGGASWTTSYTRGSGITVAASPTDTTLLIAGTSGGVDLSRDGGASFVTSNTGMTAQPVVAVATQPVDSGTIFASLGDSGLFRSEDAGVTWAAITPRGMVTEGIAVDAGNAVYITGARNFDGAVGRSIDNGTSWTWRSIPRWMIGGEIVTHPTEPGVLLMGSYWTTHETPASPLLRSTDGGATWSHSGPEGSSVVDLERHHRTSTVHALLWRGSGTTELFRSDDFGLTWAPVDAPGDPRAVATGGNADELYVGDDTVDHSFDGGQSWTRAEQFPAWAITVLGVDPLDPQQVLAGTQNQGLWLSRNSGATWLRVFSQGEGEAVHALAFAPAARPDDPTDLPARPALVGAARSTNSGLANLTLKPHAQRRPWIHGTARLDATVTCRRGLWSRASGYNYSWYRDGVLLDGATAQTRIVRRADVGHRLRCHVRAAGVGGSATSRSTAVIAHR